MAFSVVGWLVGAIGAVLFGMAAVGVWGLYVAPLLRGGAPAFFAGATSMNIFGMFSVPEPWCWVLGFGGGVVLMAVAWGMVSVAGKGEG